MLKQSAGVLGFKGQIISPPRKDGRFFRILGNYPKVPEALKLKASHVQL